MHHTIQAQEVQRLKTKLSASHTAHHALTTQLQHTQAAAVHHMCQWTQWVAQTLVKHIAHTLGQHVEDVGKHNTHTCGGEEDSTACRKEDSTACHVQCAGVTPAAPGCEASNGRNGDNDSAVPGGAVHHLSGDEICQQIRAQLHNVLCATCTNHDKGQLVNTDGQQDGIQHPTAAGAIDQPAHTHQVVHQVVDQNVDQVDAAAHALAAAITTIHTHMHTVAQKYSAHMRDHGMLMCRGVLWCVGVWWCGGAQHRLHCIKSALYNEYISHIAYDTYYNSILCTTT